jgi:universal stress protein A
MMPKEIVLAVDLYPECDITLIKKAQSFANTLGGHLTVVHAVEHILSYGIAQAYPGILDVEADLLNAAREELAKICDPLGIAAEDQIVSAGSPKLVVFEIAEKNKADLIIVGSHGRHGLGLLLGSTANSLLHNASCDVLAIRIHDDDEMK